MAKQADIIVLIPHYNNREGLLSSISSIAEDIPVDILVIDDGSAVPPDIDELSAHYKSGVIILKQMSKNRGIEHALNEGLAYSFEKDYKLIARLDCGDRCAKGRFEKQAAYFKKDQSLGLAGSWVKFIDVSGQNSFNYETPIANDELKKKMYINCMFIHPTVMMRASMLQKVGFYSYDFKAAEDYDLFFRILNRFKAINIPEFLVICELSPQGISLTRRNLQLKSRIRIILKNFHFGFYPIYGLLRNMLIFLVPVRLIHFFKKSNYRPGSY